MNNSYVLNARSLQKEGNGKYKALYKTLVKNLVSQLLDTITGTPGLASKEQIDQFLKKNAETWKQDNKFSNTQYANRILRENENIVYNEDEKKLVVLFGKEQDPVPVKIDDAKNPEAGKK